MRKPVSYIDPTPKAIVIAKVAEQPSLNLDQEWWVVAGMVALLCFAWTLL